VCDVPLYGCSFTKTRHKHPRRRCERERERASERGRESEREREREREKGREGGREGEKEKQSVVFSPLESAGRALSTASCDPVFE